jgi:peptide-methionine (S)-S-oxide reductase
MENQYLTRRSLLIGIILGGAAVILAGCSPISASETTDKTKKKVTGTKKKMELPKTEVKVPEGKEIATLANGCFWCTEAIFQDVKGVDKVVSGYSGGHVVKPSYEEVCGKKTGHAEGLQITFDPKIVSFKQLLEIFFTTHDPTTPNQQGADVGPQYRSAIFYHTPEQKETAEEVIKEFDAKKLYDKPIVTEVTAFSNFYAAEGYHQGYFNNNGFQPYCRVVIQPKVAKFREKWKHLLKR